MKTNNGCPACGKKNNQIEIQSCRVYECGKCHAIYGTLSKGDSYTYVRPFWHDGESKPDDERYYNFVCLGSEGISRRHGWFNTISKRIVQVG